jgi:hypothetical protein
LPRVTKGQIFIGDGFSFSKRRIFGLQSHTASSGSAANAWRSRREILKRRVSISEKVENTGAVSVTLNVKARSELKRVGVSRVAGRLDCKLFAIFQCSFFTI